MTGWWASLRIARRDALRHKGRSLLVMVMIGLPVAAVVFGDVAFRTLQLSPEQRVTTQIGTAADAWVSAPGGRQLAQAPGVEPGVWVGRRLHGPAPSVSELVPGATRWIPTAWQPGGRAPVASDGRRTYPSVLELEYDDPLAAGLVEQVSGRAPEAPDEVVLTQSLAEALAQGAGGSVTVKGDAFSVVGVVRMPYDTKRVGIVADPGAFTALTFTPDIYTAELNTGWLVEAPGGVDYRQTTGVNALGSTVLSRAAAVNPPDECSDQVPSAVRLCDGGSMSAEERQQLAEVAALVALVVVMALLQVVLLAGPAFSIGRRSQARDLALVAAVGGSAKAVRRVVMAGGVVLGTAGGLAGLLVGLLTFQLLRPVVGNLAGTALFPTDLRPELLVVLTVSVGTGLAAAWLPARQASHQDVVAALAGRRGITGGRRWIPALGAGAVAVGLAIAFLGALPGEPALLLFGCVVAELGLVALAPTIVAWVSRIGVRVPTAPRLALRDAGRNRTRAGTAVAAVLAAVAGATALGVYVASDEANAQRHYTSPVPVGFVTIDTSAAADGTSLDLAPVLAELPVATTVELNGAGRSCVFGKCRPWEVVPPDGSPCDSPTAEEAATTCFQSISDQLGLSWLSGGANTYQALTGNVPTGAMRQALSSGGVVAAPGYAAEYVRDGVIRLRNGATGELVELPAVVPEADLSLGLPRYEFLFAEDAYADLGLAAESRGYTVITTRAPTAAETAAATSQLTLVSKRARILVGEPYTQDGNLALVLLLSAASVLAVAATATAVGLAAADGRADLATLAAIGASPRTRRWLSASHALVVSGLGTVLGLAGGLIIGVAAINATPDGFVGDFGDATPTIPLSVPWGSLGTLALVVPLVAVALAWLFTRSRLPMVQRID